MKIYRRRITLLLSIVGMLVFSAATATTAEPWPEDAPLVSEKVRQLMQDRNYTEAIQAIDEAAAEKDAPKDYLTYLKGRALFLQNEYDRAAAVFDAMQKDFPKSRWLRRARFAKAAALARKGDFRAAELIFRKEAEYLLSPARRHEIADIYLEYADELFKPAKKDHEPDYYNAKKYYEKALEVGPDPARRVEAELLVAQCQQNLGNFSEAIKLYKKYIKDYSYLWFGVPFDTSELDSNVFFMVDPHDANKALGMEAYYRLGECYMAKGEHKLARRTWQDMLEKYGDPQYERIAEAQFELAHTWNIPKPENDEGLNLGVAALRKFIERFSEHKLASRAHLEIAASYISRGRLEDAAEALRLFLADKRYSDSKEIPVAQNLLGRCYQLQKKYTEALATWREYLIKHPADQSWSDVQRLIIDTEYLMAREKLEAKEYEAANKLFAEFLAKYPLERRSPEIMLMMNRKSCADKKWDEAIANWRRIVSKYPDTEAASQAQLAIARTLEEELGKLEESLEEYRKVTFGRAYGDARLAITRLTAKSLTVATERVFRSNETPKLKLVTRNIEAVSVRVYKVDMETYFRKMHLARGVEGLDIALIDPDRTFEFKVPEYVKHQKFENEIEIPLPGGGNEGVMAVTVGGKTLEATTLVIQSDLDVIVKSSRNEAFVFAENMLTGKPWPGVRLLVSNNQRVFAERTTGLDGVFQGSFKELKDAGDLRVFAAVGGSTASSEVGLKGVGVAQGLTDKGYIYTDRPAYRAGQTVAVRGLLRRAADDAYVIDQGKEYTLEIIDPRNRLLRRETVQLNQFGGFHTRFDLPATSPQGKYRVLVRDDEKKNFQGMFIVEEYRLEPIRLIVDTPRRVYYRGEEIEGKIRAEFYYGAPLAGREIRYRLADDRQYTATTDKNGEVYFKLPTREFSETQVLVLKVELPERNIQTLMRYVLSAQGFGIEVGTVRSVYVAGETFETTIRARDAEGKPVGRDLKLKIFEQTTVNGRVGERLVEEHSVKTDAAEGTTRKTLKLDKGGNYIVRVEGIDRFKNPITGGCPLMISDNKDRLRLRILADAHTYKVGDTATVKLHWREAPALALVTFQGARVLDYRLVELKPGINPLPIPMTAKLAPNFDLDVAVMTDPKDAGKKKDAKDKQSERPAARFHKASSPFTVERDLQVKIETRRKGDAKGPVTPGEEIEVVVTTTDPQGKPISAEASLAMVEQSLLNNFFRTVPAIGDFFRGQRRESAVRTASSIVFKYAPRTEPINSLLLAEEDRRALDAEEAAALAAMELQRQFEREFRAGEGQSVSPEPCPAPDDPFADDTTRVPFSLNGISPDYNSEIALITSAATPQSWNKPSTVQGWLIGSSLEVPLSFRRIAGPAPDYSLAPMIYDPSSSNGRFPTFSYVTHPLLPGAGVLPAAETAYWNPSIVTDRDGKATLTLVVPDRSTAWRLTATGITADTLAGEAVHPLVVRKELFGQLKLPQSFTDGDRANVTASVFNDTIDKGPISVTLKTTIGERSVEETKTIDAKAKGLLETSFAVDLKANGAERVDFELTTAAGGRRDVSRSSVPLRPYGVEVFATAAGSASSDTTAWIKLPKGMTSNGGKLVINVGPTVERSLLDALTAPPMRQFDAGLLASGPERAAADLMAGLGLQKLFGAAGDSAGPETEELDARIRASIGLLISSQQDGGGWTWTGRGEGRIDRFTTARTLWALSLARKAGYFVPDENFNKTISLIETQAAATAESDYECKVLLLHALSTVGKGDFSLANRLYRERSRLSPGALAYLALAMIEMDRRPTASELLDLLAKRDLDWQADKSQRNLPWNQSPAEMHALYALALQQVSPRSPKAKEQAEWLMAHRVGHRWSPDKATGPAMTVLCRWFDESRFETQRYTLTIKVNGKPAKVLEVDPAAGTQTIEVPSELIGKQGDQRISFQINGRGRYTYQCILSNVVPADLADLIATDDWRIERSYEPGPLEVDGREMPRGFDILQGDFKAFENPLTQLPVGRRGMVTLKWRRADARKNVPAGRLEYLVVTEPIPSGATVIDKSIAGGFDWYEISPDAITFHIGNARRYGTIHYELYGYLPGKYRAGPTLLRNAYDPSQMAVGLPKTLTVLPAGTKSADPYRLTPRELLELGRRCFARGKFEQAVEHLTELIDNWKVTQEIYREVVTKLLDASLELGSSAQVVRWFEIVKEKWPSQTIPFEKIVKVGAAYGAMGEFERSYLVFRATVESSFMRDSGVAGFLEDQGEYLRSFDVMNRLLRDYPPEGYAAEAAYALAQHVYATAPEVAAISAGVNTMPEYDVRGKGLFSVPSSAVNVPPQRKKVTRVELVHRAWEMLESFLTEYPADPAADQASFAAATALLDLKMYDQAAAACDHYAKRYPKSKLLDAFWYVIGYCRFAGGQHKTAIEMCRKVAETKLIEPKTGRETDCRNKWRAIYILGQVYHSLGKAAEAIREYSRVEDRFPDAKQSIEYFTRKAIELPEMVAVEPGKPAEVELKYRNVANCDLKVYRIDLMKFGLLKRSMGGIAQINLAGIRPYHEEVIALGDGRDYRDRTQKLKLPLKQEGAYLIVCRGGDLYASGLVLITPLALEVQADSVSGRVRATVKDRTTGKCARDVHVKVIGGRDEEIVSGRSDLRGVFVADDIRAPATVIAQAGPSRYAFYRSKGGSVEEAVRRLMNSQRWAPAAGHPAARPAQAGVSLDASEESENIRKALESPTQMNFKETPLTGVVDYLKAYHHIEVQIDRRALADLGIDVDTPITLNVRGVTLKSALRIMLRDLGLTYMIEDEVLLITTPEEAECRLQTKVYPVADLLFPGGVPSEAANLPNGGGETADFDSLIELVTSTVTPATWDEVGGTGTIAPFETGLCIVVSQTQEVHEEIENVLAKMRKVMRENGGKILPATNRRRSSSPAGSPAVVFPGGMGGGMGGMGGFNESPRRGRSSQQPDLLEGVQEMNKGFQGKQSEKLQKMYKGGQGGMGGVGAGDAF